MFGWQRRACIIRSVRMNDTVCPACGTEGTMIPVLYGKPSAEGIAMMERGEVHLAGCRNPGHPSRYCTQCQTTLPVFER